MVTEERKIEARKMLCAWASAVQRRGGTPDEFEKMVANDEDTAIVGPKTLDAIVCLIWGIGSRKPLRTER